MAFGRRSPRRLCIVADTSAITLITHVIGNAVTMTIPIMAGSGERMIALGSTIIAPTKLIIAMAVNDRFQENHAKIRNRLDRTDVKWERFGWC